ncbi:hypothetical protein [Streptomyces sp. NPDC051218]|uniref:hypothetical protein n=1 Tax=Streptomyces sp. NPDC051218 TaxID=3365645 RepID=UPI0037AE82BE
MRNTKRVVVALTVAAAALAVTGPASAEESSGEGGINLPENPQEVVDGVRTGLDVAATSWELAQAR